MRAQRTAHLSEAVQVYGLLSGDQRRRFLLPRPLPPPISQPIFAPTCRDASLFRVPRARERGGVHACPVVIQAMDSGVTWVSTAAA